ncbi:MAG TPA: DUF692 family protein [Kofleriaceae bacterium]|nr:DUF692 family protein [Kofleriaceae bacterium]
MPGTVGGVGLQLNETFLDDLAVEDSSDVQFDYAQLLCDNWAGPLDSGYVINQQLRSRFDRLAERYPLLAHSNYGLHYGFGPLSETPALKRHIAVARAMESPWIADHMFYGLLSDSYLWSTPLQFSRAEVERVADLAARFQDALGMPLLHENAFYYATFPGSDLEEAEFLAAVVEKAGTGILLDLHNIYANSIDHEGYDAWRFIRTIPLDRVVEIHLAGGQWIDGWYHDLHNDRVPEPVWEMLDHVLARAPGIAGVTIEYQRPAHTARSRPTTESWREMVAGDLRRAREIWDRHRGAPGAAP